MNLKRRSCSEYSGNDEKECQNYEAKGDNKICIYEIGKCIEKENYIYIDCDHYEGKDRAVCESIRPLKFIYQNYQDIITFDYSKKCVYGEYGCEGTSKKCSEAKSYLECSAITLSNNNKKCSYINNACVEQYKTCKLY